MNPLDSLLTHVPEIDRVKGLPKDDFLDFTGDPYTPRFGIGEQRLRPHQAKALEYAEKHRGLLANLPVGSGKTLISLLLPIVLKAQRPLLLLPASLIEKTHKEFSGYRKHWTTNPIRCISYESLGRVAQADLLNQLAPDLIVADEAHKLANIKTSACARRVDRYMSKNPATMFCALSGTMMKRSLKDFAHLSRWALKDGSPLPLFGDEVERWANAVDPEWKNKRRVPYKPLNKLRELNETQQEAVGRRIQETPGVAIMHKSFDETKLFVNFRAVEVSSNAAEMLSHMRKTWETPNGDTLLSAVDVWRHAQEMALGFYSFWEPPAPERWRNRRKEWHSFVRETIARKRKWDSPLQIEHAIHNGELTDKGVLDEWLDVKNEFTPNPVARWLDEDVPTITYCKGWLKGNPNGLIWVAHRFFGRRLERELGIPFFAGRGDGGTIEDHQGPAVLSIQANGTGRNLQRWSRCLVCTPPTAGRTWEQLLGRCHRDGQTKDVHFEVILAVPEAEEAMKRARSDAMYIEATWGQQQKLGV